MGRFGRMVVRLKMWRTVASDGQGVLSRIELVLGSQMCRKVRPLVVGGG